MPEFADAPTGSEGSAADIPHSSETADHAGAGSSSEESIAAEWIGPHLDVEFYARQIGAQKLDRADAILHYLREGWKSSLDPAPGFSTQFYLNRSPDVLRKGVNPFYHYLRWGTREGRFPNPTAAKIAKTAQPPADPVETLVRSGFDETFYAQQRPEITANHVDPVKHYLAFGWRMGLDPAPYFSTEYYLSCSPDVRTAGINPFYHYLRWGQREGRRALPEGHPRTADSDIRSKDSAIERTVRPFFDAEHYASQMPSILENQIDPLKHYLAFGWRQGLDPTRDFSTAFYLARDPTLLQTDQEPLHHYITVGRERGRLPRSPLQNGDEAANLLTSEAVRRHVELAFDVDFYLDQHPDIRREKLDPVEHYLTVGWQEGCDPAPWFSTSFYLSTYPDIEATEVNPFFHYLVWGRAAGFTPYPEHKKFNASIPSPANDFGFQSPLRALLQREASPNPTDRSFDRQSLRIDWIIPDFFPGGGGHMTIFRMVRWLEFFGHRCVIWINNPRDDADAVERYETIIKYYQTVAAPVRLLPYGQVPDEDSDVVVATSWDTAYAVAATANTKARFYFIQDYEPFFYPRGGNALAAERTYALDLACICASPWLERLMRERHGRWARRFWLATDHEVYKESTEPRAENTIPRIAFYSRVGTERRAVELGLLALEVLHKRGVSFQAELFGSEHVPGSELIPFVQHGILDAERIAELYRQCDIGVCFSSTNYSLVPLEMMACGLPVIELDAESTREVFPPGTVTSCLPDPVAIADTIEALLSDGARRAAQASTAAEWVHRFSWEQSARDVESAFLEKLDAGNYTQPASPRLLTQTRTPKASVVIPTYNGGEVFRAVLDAVQSQRTRWPYEIIVVDSGSSDGTFEFCRKRGVDILHQIPSAEFQHGRTRNLAISLGSGEFIAVLTQDALPTNAFWLQNFVTVLERHPEAAGGFGRHVAYPHMSPFVRRAIDDHFALMNSLPLVVSKHTDIARWNSDDIQWRQFLHYLSDNNACLRRTAWEKIPYPEVDYGEDQMWAREIVTAGYQKLYVPSATVYHSHDYDENETRERAAVEARFFKRHFDYDLARFDYAEELGRMNSGDLRWGIRNGVSKEEIENRYRLNAAKLRGYLEGAYS